MGEFLKNRYFISVRMMIMFAFCAYGIMFFFEDNGNTGVSIRVLLLVSFFVSCMALKETVKNRKAKFLFLLFAAGVLAALVCFGGKGFVLLILFWMYETLMMFRAGPWWYVLPFVSIFTDMPVDVLLLLIILLLLAVFYVQQVFVVAPYKAQVMEETVAQQGLKRDMENRESATREELKKNMLRAENRVLEERAELSQTLHDKLGHNINGSVYQLEAVKVLMDSDPEKSKQMIGAVTDQLRTGMDEIRAILRKQKPEKKKMALLQIYELCDNCNKKGVETELITEGDLSVIPGTLWEVILDNAFEAVSNSMKYAKCKHIEIGIYAMNKMVRCSISDDGVGCGTIVDGMGLSGMRQRIRNAGGTVSFESEAGFRVNMLLPLGV